MLGKLLPINLFSKLIAVAVAAAALFWFTRALQLVPTKPTGEPATQNPIKAGPQTAQLSAAVKPPEAAYSFETDSDEDGLANAKEFVYATDPLRADTDGDGYPDGNEVDNGYDPTIAGSARLPNEPTNLTQRFLAWAGNPPSLEPSRVIAFLDSQPDLAFRLPDIAESSIRIVPNESAADLSHYVETARDLAVPEETAPYNELAREALLGRLDGAETTLRELETLYRVWQQREVPPPAKELHRNILGLLALSRELFADLRLSRSDPVRIIWNMDRGKALAAVAKNIEAQITGLEKQP
ncbi:hypothetical protein HY442_01365 [Candidatus Parcubacteria bacterium]|nr:hypothetical protein [Candidatus Parcubacteria bacterium]MBI4099161.1 hypothetical protein [Candidatus Parcubacteria bacterium]